MALLTRIDPEPEREDERTENSPLLGDHDSRDGPPSISPSVTPTHPKFLRVVVISVVCIFLMELGDFMLRAPFMRILEDSICRSYFKSISAGIDFALPIPEEDCKLPPIQRELANLKGWNITFQCLPGFFLAVPYGMLADKHGRKLVLLLSLLGSLLALLFTMFIAHYSDVINLRWYWAANFFLLIGGGDAVTRSMFFAILADVTSEDRRAAVFFQLVAAALLSSVAAIPLSWWIMKTSDWVAMFTGLGFFLLGVFVCFFLPETLERSKVSDASDDSDNSQQEVTRVESHSSNTHPRSLKENLSRLSRKISGSHFIFSSPMLFALSLTFLLQSLGIALTEFLFQLASERFHWTLAEASFLIPIASTTNFIWLVVVLPITYHLLSHKLHLQSMIKDLIIARGSMILLVIGALGIAWGPTPGLFISGTIVFACGVGFGSSLRSLVTSLVHPDEVSRLYAVMAVGDTVGSLIYGPILSRAFGWGLNLGGQWTGMAFIVVATLYLVLGLPIWLVSEPTPEMDVHG